MPGPPGGKAFRSLGRGGAGFGFKHLDRGLRTLPTRRTQGGRIGHPAPGEGTHGLSLLLVVVAGAGGAAPDLAPQLLYQLRILLLHLLGKLLAPAGGAQLRLGLDAPASRALAAPAPPARVQPRTEDVGPRVPGMRRLRFPPAKRSTHAWMRLARSFCEGLVPGVPKGLWPPETIPDMLQGEGS